MPSSQFSRADYQSIATTIRQKTQHQPTIGLVLGSGLGSLAEAVESADMIPYESIPRWPQSTVQGHAGRLVIGQLESQTVLVMQGRFHFYEGYSIQEVTLPVRVMKELGVNTLFLTNAAGGLNPSFVAGDLMLITDQINLLGMTGTNPLLGPNDETLGERFPNMSNIYDLELAAQARQAAARGGVNLREGVYIGISGPSFESPAEIRMLRSWGGDAVGMSTVAEAVVARHAGMRVLGLSSITNVAIDTVGSGRETTHVEVLETGKIIIPKLIAVFRGVLAALR
ncbi:MAG: purine-nucleoside phosphorylase [Anaerolineae bacterium]|nr:purine-nucleoside phosphorylase [Anaerolineae bacterium]